MINLKKVSSNFYLTRPMRQISAVCIFLALVIRIPEKTAVRRGVFFTSFKAITWNVQYFIAHKSSLRPIFTITCLVLLQWLCILSRWNWCKVVSKVFQSVTPYISSHKPINLVVYLAYLTTFCHIYSYEVHSFYINFPHSFFYR